MCGISGFVGGEGRAAVVVRAMTDRLSQRGPDGSGVYDDPLGRCVLGHRRLSIIDLSETGAQPMTSADEAWVLVFNGMIYNHRDLRSRVRQRLRGTSDTEVLLELIAQDGVERTLPVLNGMFAFAAWHVPTGRLTLVRDRLGEKPLYWMPVGDGLAFASDLRALEAAADRPLDLSASGVASMVHLGFTPGVQSIYEKCVALLPGQRLDLTAGGVPSTSSWWDVQDATDRVTVNGGGPRSAAELTDEVEALLRDSVRMRLEADVPLGCLLSGGLDSSLVAALAQQELPGELRTFTLGVGGALDESRAAAATAKALSTDHETVVLDPAWALELVTALPGVYDQPFADPSALPTALVFQQAGRHLTVCLSGDGGDEVFGGYNRYTRGYANWRRAASVPRSARTAAARSVLAARPSTLDRFAGLLPARSRPPAFGDKLHKAARLLTVSDPGRLYESLVDLWPGPSVTAAGRPDLPHLDARPDLHPVEAMLLSDQRVTLPDDMLTKVDRASMAVGVEARVPLLDHRLVELSWRLPLEMKVRDGVGKRVLRTIAARHLPPDVLQRPKTGFDPPLGAWLRGPLRAWSEDLLSPDRLRRQGLLDPDVVQARWQRHLAGRENAEYALWSVLCLQQWLDSRGRG